MLLEIVIGLVSLRIYLIVREYYLVSQLETLTDSARTELARFWLNRRPTRAATARNPYIHFP